ncbi:Radical SAM-linked protein OS=Singulisphaera acidiphila (strain ATCC BAA-1392 / DSM 18658 / VKM B-2454 / MOB10) GN=Sinac_3260 PE=4 SV=1: DUF2344 [Gemmata massiliana]|uniref:DUF2344 domain-containing protein n=1 Tax=Gemmata massiliana TaxID=1210884 RepID=A0A6P2D7F0_9BACT|nr:TIGR03936 family radical SAM-associated protein [Gemmata massiliana]VTR95370.1 Radical SAM-linked protein OS=Singulisphaera acidiphila (strain ATCC BAA-1392 / DSM 18658 / VKM B-2454 / MOB10) GN=Sinac_3260 PE=4 SV=1: DUF2344 [Gemmata massiliana]
MLGDKFRFRFTKSGTLRLVSHHDLMRCSERMLRRAAVPFKSTAGFHPTPRLVFALSLPLGVIGCDEVVELELTEPRDSDQLFSALNAQAPTGLVFTRVAPVPMKATARVRRVVYELPLPGDRVAGVEAAVTALMAEPKVWVERLRPSPKRLNIRPYFRNVSVERRSTPDSTTERCLHLDLWVTQTGSARADELLRLLHIEDLIDNGAVLERTVVEIRDEVATIDSARDPADGPLQTGPTGAFGFGTDEPPDGPADSVPLTGAEAAALAARLDEEANQQPLETGWGASPNGPVVE